MSTAWAPLLALVESENYFETSFATIWRKRTVWLSCLFVAELFTFTALSYFEASIEKIVVLSLFVPLCISTGGNSGSQAATLDHPRHGDGARHDLRLAAACCGTSW